MHMSILDVTVSTCSDYHVFKNSVDTPLSVLGALDVSFDYYSVSWWLLSTTERWVCGQNVVSEVRHGDCIPILVVWPCVADLLVIGKFLRKLEVGSNQSMCVEPFSPVHWEIIFPHSC